MRRLGVFSTQIPKLPRVRVDEYIWRWLRNSIIFVIFPRLVGYRLVDGAKETENGQNYTNKFSILLNFSQIFWFELWNFKFNSCFLESSTGWGGHLFIRFRNMFSESSPCLLGQHGSGSTTQQPGNSRKTVYKTFGTSGRPTWYLLRRLTVPGLPPLSPPTLEEMF